MDLAQVIPLTVVECPQCALPLTVFERFGPFKLERLLGTGGMGAVYEATDLNLKRRLAVKVLQKNWSHDAALTAQFEREAALTARVNHPHVVRVYSTGNAHGMFYIAMELVNQGSLDSLMETHGRVPEAEVLRIGLQVAEGLQSAYRAGLIHRDIKPGNILFGEGHQSKIVDFGLALQFNQNQTPTGELWGTPFYIAPEALDFKPEDLRSDMYALGATLWHALVGTPPYECSSVSTHELLHARKKPVDLASTHAAAHPLTTSILNRTLAFSREDRHEDYESLVREFRQALVAVETNAQNTSAASPAKGSTRWLRPLGWTLLAGGLATGLGLIAVKQTHQAPEVVEPTQTHFLSDQERLSNATRLLAQKDQLDVGLRRLELISSSPSLTPLLQVWTQLAMATAYALRGETAEQNAALQAALSASEKTDAALNGTCQRLLAASTSRPAVNGIPAQDPEPQREAFRQFCLAQSAISKGRLAEAKSLLERAAMTSAKSEEPVDDLLRVAQPVLKQLERILTFEQEVRGAGKPEERASRLQRSDDLLAAMQPSWPLRNAALTLVAKLKAETPPPAKPAPPPSPTVVKEPAPKATPQPPATAQPPATPPPQPPVVSRKLSNEFVALRAKSLQSAQLFHFKEPLKELQSFRSTSPVDESALARLRQHLSATEALFQWAVSEINRGGTLPSPLLRNKSAFRSDPISADEQRVLVQTSAGGPQLPIAWNDVSLLYLVKLVQFRIERQPTYPKRAELLWGAGHVHLLMDSPQSARPFLEEAAKMNTTYAELLPALLSAAEATP